MLDIEIRLEQPADYKETEHITREAFWNHYAPGCDEHYLLHIMRDCPEFVSELDMVAVHNGRIIGNIVNIKSVIKCDNGKDYEVLSLGPISVLPEFQGKGVGKKLMEAVKKAANNMKFRGILLMGDPDYYSRQGFVAARQLGIRTAEDMYAAALQVCELHDHALADISGRYIEHPIYQINESEAEAFDQQFPEKEKVSGTPSQMRFLELVAMMENGD